jgi:hypothetical protein
VFFEILGLKKNPDEQVLKIIYSLIIRTVVFYQ